MVEDSRKKKAIAYWLLAGVFMIIVQVLLGGITRLTGSGLSITEWKPIMGAMPPIGNAAWNEAFEKYKGIAQYKYMNSHFELGDFQFIFFWEWFHRLWARTIGIVFIIGFVYFWRKGYFQKWMIGPLLLTFLLGGLVASLGWIMVASGLNDTNLYVNHIKLALHFITALLALCYTLWFALRLMIPDQKRVADTRLHNFSIFIIVLFVVQLVYGAFMAGLKAAMSAPTWPTINGMWIPDRLMVQSFINHPINVHFVHRGLAYILFVVIIIWFVRAGKVIARDSASLLATTRIWTLILIIAQVLLGIFTVVSAPMIRFGKFGQFEILAELHQLGAMFLLMALVINLYLVRKKA